ncbi:MAG: hypothetical protein ACYCYO_22165 [Bacilli bacterium]
MRITAIAAIIVKEEQQDRDSFLKQQFDKLIFVSPSSVLNCYLNGNAIRVDPQTVSDTIFPFKFNLSQKEALDNALRSQISIIEGPPGQDVSAWKSDAEEGGLLAQIQTLNGSIHHLMKAEREMALLQQRLSVY